MQVLRLNEKMRILIVYVSVFFMLFASNMVSAILLGSLVKYAFWAWGLCLLVFVNEKFTKRNLLILCGLLVFRGLIILFQLSAGIAVTSTTINSILGLILYLNTIIQTAELCTATEYAHAYINLMVGISIVSLVCFIILMSPMREQILTFAQIDDRFIHSYIHLWGLNNNIWRIDLFTRNSGPWWEPGAFQIFITYAMIMIMSGRLENNKRLRVQFFILVITWITIQSTTGYLIMGFVFLLMFRSVMEIIFQRPYEDISQKQKILLICIAICLLTVFFCTIGYANIREKLSAGNGSSTLRFHDVLSSFEISWIRPLIGVGENLSPYYAIYEITNNSAALLVIAISYGWPYLFYFTALLYGGMKHFFRNKSPISVIGAWSILLILCMTEGIVELPIMFVFFVEYRKPLPQEGALWIK